MTKPIRSVHFIARREDNTEKFRALSDESYESGNSRVSAATADSLIGAEIHLHERQKTRSWAAGRISDWRWSVAEPNRAVFRFKRDTALCREEPHGWGSGSEKKYVRIV